MKATLTAIALLLASSVTAQEKPLAEATDKPLDADSVMSPWWESFDFDFKQDDTPIDFDLSTHVEDCERAVFKLNIWSEAMDRAGGNAIKNTQQYFTDYLERSYDCAAVLADKTGKKYKVSKDWFGSGYTLKKP